MHLIFCNRLRIQKYLLQYNFPPKNSKAEDKDSKNYKRASFFFLAVGSHLKVRELLVLSNSLKSPESVILVLETDEDNVVTVTTADDRSGLRPGAEGFALGQGSQIPKQ